MPSPTGRQRLLATGCGLLTGCLLVAASGCGCELVPPSLVDDSLDLLFNEPDLQPAEVVAEGSPVYTRHSIFNEVPNKVGSHAATITALPEGDLLAAWYSYEGPHELNGSAIYMARRSAGESSWSQPWMHIDREGGDGNPVLYSEGSRVWLFQAVTWGLWSTARIEMQISEDGGVQWSQPVGIPGPVGANVRFPPVRAADGRLLLPAYDDLLQRALLYSSPEGTQWSLVGAIDADPPGIQPCLAVLEDGGLLGVMRNTATGWMWVTASNDGGFTWAPAADSGFPNSNSPAALLSLAGGHLLLVFNDSITDRSRLTAAISADGGRTWPYRRLLAGEDEQCSYPTVVEAPDGFLHVVFSVNRDRIDHVTFNQAWLVSPGAAKE